MKFERSELGALFSKLRTAVPEVRAVGTDDAGILLSGSNAYATNLELSVRAGLSKPVEQDVVVPPRGVDFISGTVAPEISIEADKGILTVKSGTARARLNTTPAENYPKFSGPVCRRKGKERSGNGPGARRHRQSINAQHDRANE